MSLIDRLEKLGRLLLWLSLVLVLVGVPLSYASQGRAEEPLRQALAKAEAQLAEATKPKRPMKLSIASMQALRSFDQQAARGDLFFTNVSSRSGILCIAGMAVNPNTKDESSSLPVCQEIQPYASLVHISLMFAGGSLAKVCGRDRCDMHVEDVPDFDGEKVAAK